MKWPERIVVLLMAGALLAGLAAGGSARPAPWTADGPAGVAALESPTGPGPALPSLRDRQRPGPPIAMFRDWGPQSHPPLAWLGLGGDSSAGPMPPGQAAESAGHLRAVRGGPGSLVALHVQITI